ncbi:DNA repair ATPase [Coraliomargarita algicola]|uniref:DNA repair ATPase n=1 Tax=Coraliomargarita algicola TaxID=3092156 RepID=A0ABZ0RT14_9BACT|nr:DNA repair ATPase [Coraliomargarita sp. J2-16]WPJ98110.1 DNA repair ATPase [Coraliomargarita sp. J2-16]
MESQNPAAGQKLEGGAYEVIRNRLTTQSAELLQRVQQLDGERKTVFGAVDTHLLATDRIQTSNNCIPRGMIALPGGRFIFGYNVHMGLKSQVEVTDVFAKFRYDVSDHSFHEEPLNALESSEFQADFQYLYKYYKNTFFAKFMIVGPHLLMVFQISDDLRDIKVFKWLIQGEQLTYLGNRFEQEYVFPDQHSFEWTRAHRDLHRTGTFPHVSIEDRLFVETIGGDLTIKIEDNTDSGEGIYTEPVDNPDQTLDDADIHYASVGSLIFLRIKPYQEKQTRYFIYNEKVKEVKRVDSVAHSCVMLPEDHGVIFADGYYLHNGDFKRFSHVAGEMTFERVLKAPNGEDFLYVFYQQSEGLYQLLSYNLIAQKVESPIEAHGYSIFENGSLIYFKAHDEPQKHHTLQIWQTPYAAEEVSVEANSDSYLFKIGNASIVRCIAECHSIYNLLQKEDAYEGLYLDLVKDCVATIDSYFWLGSEDAFNLKATLSQIRDTGQAAIAEFEKVQRIRKSTLTQTRAVQTQARKLFTELAGAQPDDVRVFVDYLASLRRLRGEVIGLRDLKYVDLTLCDELEQGVATQIDSLAQATVEFLLQAQALVPYQQQLQEVEAAMPEIKTAAMAKELLAELDATGAQLEMLIEMVSNLKIEDATETTRIIDAISDLFTELNRLKAEVKRSRQELMRKEGSAQFQAQIKLLEQSVANYLDIADEPERCDEFLTKAVVQLEELEGKYAEFDEFIEILSDKRSELYNTFESKKASLQEVRNRRVSKLVQSAQRILNGIENRSKALKEINDINGYFASDLMVDKVRDLVEELKTLGEGMKGDELLTRLKTIQGDAVRQLKDKQELFVDGENLIKFGRHAFTVNSQALELTSVLRDGDLYTHLSGTQFYEKVEDPELLETKPAWKMHCCSENDHVYRAEDLAYKYLESQGAEDYLQLTDEERLESIREFMAPRYQESYTKGVHDFDARVILDQLAETHSKIGLLRYSPEVRACALVFWHSQAGQALTNHLRERIDAFGQMLRVFPNHHTQRNYIEELSDAIGAFAQDTAFFESIDRHAAGAYLFYEIVQDADLYCSKEAADLIDRFQRELLSKRFDAAFKEAVQAVSSDVLSEYRVIYDWLEGYAVTHALDPELRTFLPESAAHLLRGGLERRKILNVPIKYELAGLKGDHRVIEDGGLYHFNYLDLMQRMQRFESGDQALFLRYERRKKALLIENEASLRLNEFKPQVLSAFVRNRLLDEVYLPLIGDNFAKQIGSAGEDTRTDRMGLLLLISPPGYGKTTLMEYVANRLGITFVKVNGPSLGHEVTSLDPAQCPNLAARQEVEKINLAFEMGDNVLIYLDDIQHTNPEFLQKFISLCDGTRRIEGVYKGKSRTYDFRGRKVAVVMAGNPYTEAGGKFQIPDMLANRADTYNLGDIIGENSQYFEASYIENSLTSNRTLGILAGKDRKDVYAVMQIAETGQREGVTFESSYSMEEINDMVAVMKMMMRVRDTILRVNLEYVRSAAQADDYRTEPSFKLQGSYRNMNRIAEKLLPIMTDEEVEQLIVDHYTGEAQTLTDGAEANLLKFKEIEGKLSEQERARWDEIKKRFNRKKLLGGSEGDPINRVVAQLSDFKEGLDGIGQALVSGRADAQNGIGAAIQQLATVVQDQGALSAERVRAQRSDFEQFGADNLPQLLAALQGISAHLQQSNGQSRELSQAIREAVVPQREQILELSETSKQEVAFSLDESSLRVLNTLISSIDSLLSRISVNHNGE